MGPKRVHLHIERVMISDIPLDEVEFTQWLRGVYKEKDRRMIRFFDDGIFDKGGNPGRIVDVKPTFGDLSGLLFMWIVGVLGLVAATHMFSWIN